MLDDIKEILLTEEQLKLKAKELAGEITKDYKNKDLVIISILKGGVMFTSDLIRYIKLPLELDFMAVSSYGHSHETTGVVRIIKDLKTDIEDKELLIVEDIIDSGLTLKYLTELLKSRKPKSIKICTILNKPARRQTDITVDYLGFDIPDEFVVGYGLDYAERYRNLPYVAVLKPEVYQK